LAVYSIFYVDPQTKKLGLETIASHMASLGNKTLPARKTTPSHLPRRATRTSATVRPRQRRPGTSRPPQFLPMLGIRPRSLQKSISQHLLFGNRTLQAGTIGPQLPGPIGSHHRHGLEQDDSARRGREQQKILQQATSGQQRDRPGQSLHRTGRTYPWVRGIRGRHAAGCSQIQKSANHTGRRLQEFILWADQLLHL